MRVQYLGHEDYLHGLRGCYVYLGYEWYKKFRPVFLRHTGCNFLEWDGNNFVPYNM